ncbi:uncharacterized protein LOC124314772 isoform X2 [Daphnia pulicaria]|nr:uncharacterized protein LOC124314772 isoform X2 [Daphnia pulicaria]
MPSENEVFLQLAKGLAHIHEKGLIHRDLKPENVLIWSDSGQEIVVMKWADFGLSKQVNPGGSHSISGMRGTHNWYSPEILKIFIEEEGNDGKTTKTTPNIRQRGTVKSDVYTAGLVFGYYLLGGDHPFGSPINIQLNILKNEPVNLPKMREQHPMHSTIIVDMWKANPNERISSADVVTRINNLIKFHYIKRYIGIVSTEDDSMWNEFLASAPMGIAVFSQLMICTSQLTDFRIDNINKEKTHLIKKPNSFRTTLVQIADDACSAFMKAQTNMEKIQSQMVQLAVYVIDCVKIIKSDNKVDIEVLVPRRLECIIEAADDGKKLSKEVLDAFELLGQLILQVLLAIKASRGAKEQEIQAAIYANIKEKKRRQEAAINGQKKSEKEMKKICDEFIKSLENMHIDIIKDISTDSMMQILKDGMNLLSKLQENWTGMTLYFQSINSYIEDMKTKHKDFVEDAKVAQEDSSTIDFMAESIEKSLETSIKSHHIAATYVKVSNSFIMEPLRNIHGMLSIEPAEIPKAQGELVESCKIASKGIKIIFKEDEEQQAIREMENALQSPDPFKVLFRIDDID